MTARLPALYIPHGAGPCFFMDWQPQDTWTRMADWLRGTIKGLPEKPRAILVVSAHWEMPAYTVGSAPRPGMLFDYSGFPEHTYRFDYASPGDPPLAARVRALLDAAGLPNDADDTRGYDHGVFVPLMLMAPDADIPVIQLSLRIGLDAAEHAAVGRALAPLRDEGVYIVGSGMSYHNMRGYAAPSPRRCPSASTHGSAKASRSPRATVATPRSRSGTGTPMAARLIRARNT